MCVLPAGAATPSVYSQNNLSFGFFPPGPSYTATGASATSRVRGTNSVIGSGCATASGAEASAVAAADCAWPSLAVHAPQLLSHEQAAALLAVAGAFVYIACGAYLFDMRCIGQRVCTPHKGLFANFPGAAPPGPPAIPGGCAPRTPCKNVRSLWYIHVL